MTLERLKRRLNLPKEPFFALCLIKPKVKYFCVTVKPEAPLGDLRSSGGLAPGQWCNRHMPLLSE